MMSVTTNENASTTDRGDELVEEQLGATAVEQALVDDRAVDRGLGEEAEQQRADEPADEVHGDDVEAVVELERLLDARGRGSTRTPAMSPIQIGDMPPTNPAHGVMATRPATAPDAAPSVVAVPSLSRSTSEPAEHRRPRRRGTCS